MNINSVFYYLLVLYLDHVIIIIIIIRWCFVYLHVFRSSAVFWALLATVDYDTLISVYII